MTPEQISTINFLASMPSGHTTVTTEDLRAILLETGAQMLARGLLYNIESKHLGAGVYKIFLRLANT